jgi:PleD family two-component response regulator
MRAAIERLRIPRLGGGSPLAVTASFGVASVPESADDSERLFDAAFKALARAKRGGKNRVGRATGDADDGPVT